jgi:hypothetical protein
MPVRIKVLRYVWEQGWSGARSMRPWSDGVFAEIFQGTNGWSVRDFWQPRADLEFDIAGWGVLYGQSHERLRDDREAILGACLWQARLDQVATGGWDHVIAFVHEPPANSGVVGADAVLDQGVGRIERYYQEVGRLLGFDSDFEAGAGGTRVLPGVELWHGGAVRTTRWPA